MADNLIIETEKRIIRAAIDGLLAAGYALSVDDGETASGPKDASKDPEAILAALFTVDEEHLIVRRGDATGKYLGWVFLVHGNGVDVISDYHTFLDAPLANALKLAEELGG